ncbi:MAG: hypothetical protein FOGNACKC_02267 [Anaerolineae bacterium]|nr:hypothetical protein [Anaerolineae bacterium]
MLDLDELLDQAVAEGELESGLDPALVAARSPRVTVRPDITATASQAAGWSTAEECFIANYTGHYSDAEIAAALGRSVGAVKIRRYRHLRIAGASVNLDFMSATRVAHALGIDGHSAIKLADRDILPVWRYSEREIRLTRRTTFLRWAVNPLNWVYFIRSVRDTSRLGDAHLRRLIKRQKQRWPDEWWSIGEVAQYHGVGHTDVNRYIRAGKLTGVKWGNWWVLRSEALKEGLYFFKGKGAAQDSDWSEAADVFLITGVALGVMQQTMAGLMNWPLKHLTYRLQTLRRSAIIPDLIAKYDLAIEYNPGTGDLRADWADYGYLFPRVKGER